MTSTQKIIAGSIVGVLWLLAIVAKHFWSDIDTAAFTYSCGLALTALGIHAAASKDSPPADKGQGGFVRLPLLVGLAAASVLALGMLDAQAGSIHRSQAAKLAFVKKHACPSTHMHRLPCPGYVIDHMRPLCANGIDAPKNMAWSALPESRAKDREEVRLCAMIRRGEMAAGADTADLCLALSPSQWPLLTKALCVETQRATGNN